MNERSVLVVLIVLLASQLAALASQVPSREGGQSQLEAAVLQVVAPAARLVLSTDRGLQGVRDDWQGRETLEQRVEVLAQKNLSLETELLRLRGVEDRLRQVSAALRYTPPATGELRLADVVYADHASFLRVLVVWAPNVDLRRNQPVLTEDGLVGRTVLVSGEYAKVQLITDRAAAVGAMLERTRRQGLVQGSAEGRLELAYIQRQSEVRKGDRVMTSGVDGLYPRGLDIGTVSRVRTDADLFHDITVTPAVDFTTLDHVYILDGESVPDAVLNAEPEAGLWSGEGLVQEPPAASQQEEQQEEPREEESP